MGTGSFIAHTTEQVFPFYESQRCSVPMLIIGFGKIQIDNHVYGVATLIKDLVDYLDDCLSRLEFSLTVRFSTNLEYPFCRNISAVSILVENNSKQKTWPLIDQKLLTWAPEIFKAKAIECGSQLASAYGAFAIFSLEPIGEKPWIFWAAQQYISDHLHQLHFNQWISPGWPNVLPNTRHSLAGGVFQSKLPN